MKLISLNIGLFESNNKQVTKFLKQQQPDIVCLQEVTKKLDSSAKNEFVSWNAVEKATKQLTHSFFAPTWVLSDFTKNDFHGHDQFKFDLEGKVEFGNLVKSKFPITHGQNIFVQNHFAYVTDWSNWPETDSRAFQMVDFQLPSSKLRVINYHGIWSKSKAGSKLTRQACQKIAQTAAEVNYPVIVCGDFNLFPSTDSIDVLNQHLTNLCDLYQIKTTRPSSNELSNKSRNVVDYIFVNSQVHVHDFEVVDSQVSDHLPLVVEFDL